MPLHSSLLMDRQKEYDQINDMRNGLFSTCRFARELALVAKRKDLELVVVGQLDGRHVLWLEVEGNVLEIVDKLIEEVRGRRRSEAKLA